MDSILLLTCIISFLIVGGHGYSQSMSCSIVNGQRICERQAGDGNTAGAFAGSSYDENGDAYQDVSAMTGNSWTGQSQTSRAFRDPFRRFGVPNFNPSQFVNQYHHPGGMHVPNPFIGTGASEATSFNSPNGNIGISTSGFSGASNNNGIPRSIFGGFAVADAGGDMFNGLGNTHGGGLIHGNPGSYNPYNAFESAGLGAYGFPFNYFERKR